MVIESNYVVNIRQSLIMYGNLQGKLDENGKTWDVNVLKSHRRKTL